MVMETGNIEKVMKHLSNSFQMHRHRGDVTSRIYALAFGTSLMFAPSACNAQDAAASEKLDTVVVTATLQDSLMAECPASISVLDEAIIEELGALSVDQALEEIPGLSVEMNSGRISRPSIRGTNAQQTLVIIDGRRQAPGFKRMSDLNQILVGGIERIEVLRGPVSSLYGSEAIGGIVNIITKKAPKAKTEGMLSTYFGGGEYNEYAAGVSGGTAVGKVTAYGSVGYRYNEGVDDKAGTYSWPDEVTLYGGFMNAGVQASATTEISGGVMYTDSVRKGYRAQKGGSYRNAHDERGGAHLQLTQAFGESTTAVVRGYVERYDCDISMTSSSGSTFSDMRNELAVLDGHVTTDLFSTLSTTLGGEFRRETYDDFSDDEPEDEMNCEAGFAQVLWNPVKSVNIVCGGRVDHYDDFDSHVTPQLSGIWQFAENWSIRAGYGCGFRAPNSMELNLETMERQGKITVLPNPDLDPESSATYEVGLRRSGKFWSFALTAFHTEVEDMIEQVSVAKNTTQWTNLSSVTIKGAEMENGFHFSRNLSLENFVCWLDPENDETGFHVEGQRQWTVQTSLVGKLPEWGLTGRISLRCGSDEWAANDAKEETDEKLDIRVQKHLFERWALYIGVRDLTASDDVDRRYYGGVNVRF